MSNGSADDAPEPPDTLTGALFGDAPVIAQAPSPVSAYRVLARKYRPSHFGDLIGQDAMVRTLTNAFASNRIPQAWMLTGVRGVGKTTTARILARALNFQRADGSGQPTTDLVEYGVNCRAIVEGRHIDVMEMDAASNTSVDAVRQINDAVRYAPVSARYKVYIIDEVHMLSGSAFNAFLKTLEEPPPHAKFIFATTEIRKVPVTILSRCQRFDLRRVDAGLLTSHLAMICGKEGVAIDDEALALIARAAEGSVRDSLSLLDQAISHGAGEISAESVRAMLGLADRARVIDLFGMVLKGDLPGALHEMQAQYQAGADPLIVMTELASFTHLVTRLKVTPEAASDASLTQIERQRGGEWAGQLSIRSLTLLWQVLTRGLNELRDASRPLASAEMLLVRLCHAAELPTPDEALRALANAPPSGSAAALGHSGSGAGGTAPASAHQRHINMADSPLPPVTMMQGGLAARAVHPATVNATAPQVSTAVPRLACFEDVVALAGEMRDLQIKRALENDVRLVRFEEGRIEVALERSAPRGLANDLSSRLQQWTGRPWMVAVVPMPSAHDAPPVTTLRERTDAIRAGQDALARAHPAVQAALARFPGAMVEIGPRGGDISRMASQIDSASFTAGDLPPFAGIDDDGLPEQYDTPYDPRDDD
jgi:DNA polymerase III subunit gamma/tau